MRHATLLTALAAVLTLAPQAWAQCTGTEGVDFQRVTLDEVNALPQSNIDALNAAGTGLTAQQIDANIESPLEGETIEFTAVILTDPLKSGLASPVDGGPPGRYHVFVRDTAAETEGVEGMGAQIVDGTGSGVITTFFVGDEVTVCGTVSSFNNQNQISPISITSNDNPRSAGDPILDPVVITTDDIHDVVGSADETQLDWSVYPDFVNQYVRFEGIELVQGVPGTRPNMLLSSVGEDAAIGSYDTSVCFRNDRNLAGYYPGGDIPECVTNGDFVPPPTGIVNVQGFLTFPEFDAFAFTSPLGAAFSLVPFDEADFEIAVAPPIVDLEDTGIATSAGGAVVRATVVPGTEGNTVASVVADYTTSSGASGQVTLEAQGNDVYEGTISGLSAGEFVSYTITATDNEGAATPPSSAVSRRVVDGAISSIFDIQATPDGGPGASGLTTESPVAFDLDATVQSTFFGGSLITIQDDPSLGPFSGVWVEFDTATGLEAGDQINISEARVVEDFGLTTLMEVAYTETGSGDPLGYKAVTTDLFNGDEGDETAEQHEGMLLSFSDVTIVATNADAPSGPFGEFLVSSDGTEANGVRVDDLGDIAYEGGDPATVYAEGNMLSFVRGPLYYSFSNFKLEPTGPSDIGELIVSNEGGLEASALGLGVFPNPSAGALRVRFALGAAADVSLRVFDATGREVASLVEAPMAAAEHTVEADLGGLAAGVYVVRLEAAGDVATARLAVVR